MEPAVLGLGSILLRPLPLLLPAVSEVSNSLQPGVLLFSCGGRSHQEEELRSSLRVQNLDLMLEDTPRHQPHHTTRKGFNGEPAFLVVVVLGWAWANYGPRAICGPLKLLIWLAKLEEMISKVSKSKK